MGRENTSNKLLLDGKHKQAVTHIRESRRFKSMYTLQGKTQPIRCVHLGPACGRRRLASPGARHVVRAWSPRTAWPPWREQRGLTGGLYGDRWTARVRRECEGRAGQEEVCHDSPRQSSVDEAAESGIDGDIPAVVDGLRGLAAIRHRPYTAVRGRGR
jgi:hypothetical protein